MIVYQSNDGLPTITVDGRVFGRYALEPYDDDVHVRILGQACWVRMRALEFHMFYAAVTGDVWLSTDPLSYLVASPRVMVDADGTMVLVSDKYPDAVVFIQFNNKGNSNVQVLAKTTND